MFCLVLATVPTRPNGSGLGLEPNPDHCNGSYHTKTRTVPIGPVLPPKTRQLKSTILPPIKYLSSDCIITWWIRRLCSFSRSFTCRLQICDPTNIRGVAIAHLWFSLIIGPYFTATRRISVGSHIWTQEVKELVKLHNLRIHYVMIWSELKYLIGGKVAWTVIWKRGPGWTRPKNRGFMSGPGNNPVLVTRVGLLGGSWPRPGPSGRFLPGPKPGHPEPLLTLVMPTANQYT
jgi:hypothetical protein